MLNVLKKLDEKLIEFISKHSSDFARFSLFLIYFWFGILKVLGYSPASDLIHSLFDKTLSMFISFDLFYILFALFEVAIGISFLFPKLLKVSFYALIFHTITTMMPLILLANQVWQHPLVPTFEGQYILKNFITLGLVFLLVKERRKNK